MDKEGRKVSEKAARDKKIKELKERADRTREGRGSALWDCLIQVDPDMFEAYQTVYERGLLDGKHLPAKYRELVAMAILAYRGLQESVISHARRAHKLGATKEEILDAAETTLIPGGAPTFSTYLAAVKAIEEEEEKEKAAKNKSKK